MTLRQSKLDQCLWWGTCNGAPLFVCHHVDDLLVAAGPGAHKLFVQALFEYLQVTSRGLVDDHVGIQFEHNKNGTIRLHQTAYATELLRTYGMQECKQAPTPMAAGQVLEKGEVATHPSIVPQELCGQLGWLCMTRPDLRFVTTQLAQLQTRPTKEFFSTARRVLRYIQGTRNVGIEFKPGGTLQLEVYCDASWAPGNDRKSISGALVLLDGAPIDWLSKRQTCVATSSGDAEIFAMSKAVELALQHRQLLDEVTETRGANPVPVFTDSTVAQQFANNPAGVKRSRAISIRYHHVRDQAKSGLIRVGHVSTEQQLADILTKGCTAEQHSRLSSRFLTRAAAEELPAAAA